MKHLDAIGSESATRRDPTAAPELPPSAQDPAQLPALPPLADLISREIRRMGRTWKIEGVKSLLHVALTMLIMTVLGTGWLIFFAVASVLGWNLWSTFSLKATVKSYELPRRRAQGSEPHDAARNDGEEFADWLIGPEHATD